VQSSLIPHDHPSGYFGKRNRDGVRPAPRRFCAQGVISSTNSQTDRYGAQRVVLQMGIALSASGLTMPKYLADEVEAAAAGYGDRGEAVPKVMNAGIVEPGRRPNALPGLLNADEMSFAALSGQNVWGAVLSRQLGQRAKRERPKRHGLGPGLLSGRSRRSKSIHCYRIDRISDRRHPVRIRSRIATTRCNAPKAKNRSRWYLSGT
jgi:hypothetical protein